MQKWFTVLALVLALAACGGDDFGPVEVSEEQVRAVADPMLGTWSGDLDEMVERRQIRVLVPYSRTFFFVDGRGTQRGLMHAYMEAFGVRVNQQYGRERLPIQIVYVPVTRDRLIPWLLEGRGDVIAANLTITEARSRQVLFTEPVIRQVREVLVSGPSAARVDTLEDLSGKRVYVRPEASFFESLTNLNERFVDQGLAPIILEPAPDHFETGDVLELVSAGVVDHAVSDDYLARFWSRVLPDLTIHDDVILRDGAEIAFAIRPDSSDLKAVLDEFLQTHRSGTLFGNIAFERFLHDTRWVMGDQREAQLARFRQMAGLFQQFGQQYELDWLLLVAQGYQESRLDHSARSPAGAVGVMQILPSTGEEMGFGDVTELEDNIHAGARYLRWMMDRYYADESMDEDNRLLFALASYNAGPRRVREMRARAEAEGLDPNEWFNNVEYVASRVIGRETVDYVSNIFKYHIAFRLIAAQELGGLKN